MVLKSLIRYIINKYLKDYIEQLDNEKLKLDLRHGKSISLLFDYRNILFQEVFV